ncbi:MAG: hypothetical protein DRQ40_00445 [Gammaproteobacteria bacterium]|nr:MAG: hypothetical protein DRQ40_00445 [Gammaproteobacteria bacterium]
MILDLTKKVSIKNHLWLSWDKVKHLGDGTIALIKPRFTGPVLQDCEAMEVSGRINLDLTHHFVLLLPKPYVVVLSWDKLLKQDCTEVTFDKMIIKDTGLGKLSLLTNNDRIFLNCQDQTTEAQAKGTFKLAFEIMVFNNLNQPYDLSK